MLFPSSRPFWPFGLVLRALWPDAVRVSLCFLGLFVIFALYAKPTARSLPVPTAAVRGQGDCCRRSRGYILLVGAY